MAAFALTDAVIFGGALDLTGFSNQVSHAVKFTELDTSAFGDTWRTRIAGAGSGMLNVSGFLDFADPDATLFAALGTVEPYTVAATTTDGDPAYLFQTLQNEYEFGGQYDEVAKFAGTNPTTDINIGGKYLFPKQTVTGAVTGTGRQFTGGVAAGESLYTVIHVFTAGTTCDVIVESDDNSGFTTATTRSTTTVTATGGTWVAPVAGAITDDWYRVRTATVTGTFSIAAAVGIG